MTRVAWIGRRVEWLGAVESFAPTKTLADIVPEVRPKFEALIAQATAWGMQPSIRSAGRTCSEQQEQVKLGYSKADLCRGMHVLGHAIDVDLAPNTCATYTKLGEWWEAQGGKWGGRWVNQFGFGACGDQGHFMYGFGGAQAVPTSVCPSGVSLAECVQIRTDYLNKAFGQSSLGSGGSRMGILSGLAIIGAAAAILYATVNVKGARIVRENPKRRSARELQILSRLMDYAPFDDTDRQLSWAEYQLDRYKEKHPQLWESLNEQLGPDAIAEVISDKVYGSPMTAKGREKFNRRKASDR